MWALAALLLRLFLGQVAVALALVLLASVLALCVLTSSKVQNWKAVALIDGFYMVWTGRDKGERDVSKRRRKS